MRYQYTNQVAGFDISMRKTQFNDDVESFAHLAADTVVKLAANGPKSEQTLAYLAMLRSGIEMLEEKHFGGPLTPGGAKRMLGNEWTDEP